MTTKEEEDDARDHGFNVSFFRRFWRLQHLLFPGIFSLPLGLFALLLLVALLGNTVWLLICFFDFLHVWIL
jgi:hypothetical protein